MSTPFRLAILNSHPVQYFAPLYRRLAQEPTIDLTVFYCSRQGAEPYLDTGFGVPVLWDLPLLSGYRHQFLPNLRRSGRVGGFFSLVNPSILRELRRGRYDALWVHGHNYLTFLLAILVANAARLPVLMRSETHLLLPRSGIKRAVRAPVMRFFYGRLCARCLPIGTRNRQFYLAHGVSAERLFTVPYAVDNAFFANASAQLHGNADAVRAELGLPAGKPLILFASKLTPRKHPKDLLSAYHRLRSENVEAALLFVGSGQMEADLKEYAAVNGLPDVYFSGFRNQSAMPAIYEIADVFVLPSENEPWGLVINEAMCTGLPIVASWEVGAVPDLVKDDYNGFAFRAGDIGQLTACLKSLVSDPAMRQRMGENSRALISDWDFERCVQGILEALESLPRN